MTRRPKETDGFKPVLLKPEVERVNFLQDFIL